MIALAPLFAAGEWLAYIVPIVMFIIWMFNQLMGETPAAKQRKAMQRARPKPAAPPPAERQRIEDEVGEFLRRAAGQRSGKETQPVAPAGTPVRQSRQQNRPRSKPAEPVTVAPETADKLRTMLEELPEDQTTWNLRDVRAQGQEVDEAVMAMESHLTQTFGHRVGNLAQPSAGDETTTSQVAPANELVVMLRDPQSIRHAIIVSEILRRPEERW